jgi:hypothetical protein
MTTYGVGPTKPPSLPVGLVFKQAFQLSRPLVPLLGLAAIPVAIQILTAVVTLLVGLPRLRVDYYTGSFASLFVLVPAIIVGGGLLSGLASTHLGALAAVRASAAADRRPSSLSEAFTKTKTVAIRVLPAWLLLGLFKWLGFAGVGWLLRSLRRSDPSDPTLPSRIIMGFLMILLTALGLGVGSMLLRVKLFLFAPVAGFEKAEGFSALLRSWQLTRGAFGPILVFTLAVGAVTGLTGAFTIGAWFSVLQNLSDGLAGVPATTYLVLAVWLGISAVVSLFTTPLLWMCATGVYRMQTGMAPIPRPPLAPVSYGYPVPPSWAPQPGTPFPPPSARQPGNW